MRRNSWFSRWSRQWGQALKHSQQSLRSQRRDARKCNVGWFMEPMESRILLSAPTLATIGNVEVGYTAPVIVGLDGADAESDALSYTVNITKLDGTAVTDPHLTTQIISGVNGTSTNKSLVINVSYYVNNVLTTGTMVFELFDNLVPEITSQFEALVTSGHYNGLAFDRLEKDFVIQTGSYKYTSGSYVYQSSTHATFEDQFNVDLLHTSAGLLSSAKTSADDTNSTNFFITDYAGDGTSSEYILRNLDFNHSVFGKIVEGMDVFDAITQVATYASGNINRPSTPITITSATIKEDPENATLLLKVTSGYTANEQLLVTVTATDGDNETVTQSFEVTLTNDRLYDDNSNYDYSYILQSSAETAAVIDYVNIYNSNPFLNTIGDIYIPAGSSIYTLTVTSTDIDGYKPYYFEEYIDGTKVASIATETATLSILNQDTLGADGQPLNTTYGSANYWGNYLDLTTYTPDDIDTTGLTYTIGNATTSGNQQSIDVKFTGITSNTVGVYHILLARYNTVTSTKTGNSYDSTAYDTQVITFIVRPATPTLTINSGSGGLTNDSTPSVTVDNLIGGAKLQIRDEEDHLLYEVVVGASETSKTFDLTTALTGDGDHVLHAVQIVNDATSEAGTATITLDTTPPQAFTDVALAAAQVNNTTTTDVYTFQIGHPEANEGTVTFSLEANHAGDVIPTGMSINATTGLLTWTNPTDANFPSVTFDIVAEDSAGNQTVEHVTLQVNSYVDISGVVYLDANDSGTADPGEEQGGVLVYADLNGNNIADENELESYSAITASNGGYELHNVPAGTVVLHQQLADGYQQLSPTDTKLTQVQVIKDGDATILNETATTIDGLTWAGALAMSPDGNFVYATSGRDSTSGDDAIAVFERNADDGSLTYIQLIKNNIDGITGLDDPNNLVVTPDGRHVYVTCNNSTAADTVVIFERDAESGKLTQVGLLTDGGTYALNGASNVTVSADDEFVYISAADSKAINVFSRNRFSGQLTFVDSVINETRLLGVSQMTISPDGAYLYAGSKEGMVVYTRDMDTGMLTAIQNVDGDYLNEMRQIAIAPDGTHLYAASYGDNALNIFQRDMNTGLLTLQNVLTGQNGATSVKISPDGTKLYFTALFADALYVYDIQSNGALSLTQTLTRNSTDLLGQHIADLDGDTALLLSPDGNDLYVTSRAIDTLGVYSNRTRSWSGAALIVDATPTNDNTGQNFLNDYNAVTVDSVDYNLLEFNSDRPDSKSANAPINWTTQRSSIRDITVTFSAQLNEADTANNILLQRVFDVDGNTVSETITLAASDVTIVGNQLIISNLDLADGVYQLTVYQTFDAALDGLYSTVFHQLLGDFNGDKAVSPADLTALIYWQQLAAGPTSYGDVPAYLDVRNASDQPIADGRVDRHDFDVITSKFGKFIPKSAIPEVPIPQVVLASTAPSQSSDMLAMAFYTSQPVSLQLIASDDDSATTGLLDQLDNPNMVLEMLDTP